MRQMKSRCVKLLLVLFAMTGVSNAFADCSLTEMNNDPRSKLPATKLIDITADYYPDQVFKLGYTLNQQNLINSVYYEDEKACRRYFSFKDLSGQVTIITHTDGKTVYNLVQLHAVAADVSNEYLVTMSYMTNGLFKSHRSKVFFNLRYNEHLASYELLDAESGKSVFSAYASTNYWLGQAVGINKINFQ